MIKPRPLKKEDLMLSGNAVRRISVLNMIEWLKQDYKLRLQLNEFELDEKKKQEFKKAIKLVINVLDEGVREIQ